MQRFCLAVLSLLAQHESEVVYARQRAWVLFAQCRRSRLPQKSLYSVLVVPSAQPACETGYRDERGLVF
jgi:hypothetical protein